MIQSRNLQLTRLPLTKNTGAHETSKLNSVRQAAGGPLPGPLAGPLALPFAGVGASQRMQVTTVSCEVSMKVLTRKVAWVKPATQ